MTKFECFSIGIFIGVFSAAAFIEHQENRTGLFREKAFIKFENPKSPGHFFADTVNQIQIIKL